MKPLRRAAAPAILAGAAVALAGGSTILAWAAGDISAFVNGSGIVAAVWCVLATGVGALLVRDTPGNLLGPLFIVSGLWVGIGGLAGSLADVVPEDSSWQIACMMVDGLWFVSPMLFLMVPVLYPDGRAQAQPWRAFVRIGAVAIAVAIAFMVTSPLVLDSDAARPNPLDLGLPEEVTGAIALLCFATVAAISVAALVIRMWRLRRGSSADRARLAWLLTSVLFLLGSFFSDVPLVSFALDALGFAALVIGIVRYGLFDIQRILTRGLVYALIVGASFVVALVASAGLGSASEPGALPVVLASITAVALATIANRLHRIVDRVLFGPRIDVAVAMVALGERLADAPLPEDALPAAVEAVRSAFRLPYAAVTLVGETEPAASAGVPEGPITAVPLAYGSQAVGTLDLGMSASQTMPDADAAAVATFAAQIGAAAHAAQVTRALRRSRERLVLAREEERRSMRRELHDGVGPTLAGMALGLESLSRPGTGGDRERLATDLHAQAIACLEEVRRLARDLRPAALDELGFVPAVLQHAELASRLSGGRPQVTVTIDPADLPALPAAVEVAAYRIIQEALSNATRHASAAACEISVKVGRDLILTVSDNGSGAKPTAMGSGLRSMRERADELGGTCSATFTPSEGTVVRAVIPISGAVLAEVAPS